ncbi:hypothetical protein [Georgenia sp. H159]|uniref:hypothetical protein n=1 Tax=Georgenia sp. H159 TaxID=3076115 RepID=UPI002D771548|nr:hypothetical protein [Georgenia sp. H159]
MRTTITAALYWTLVALGSLAVVVAGVDLAVADRHPVPEHTLAGVLPRSVFLVVVAGLALVLAATAALMADADRERATAARRVLIVPGAVAAVTAVLLTLSTELLALIGYLPLLLVLAPFDDEIRGSLVAALDVGVLVEALVVLGVLLWGGAVRQYLRGRPVRVPAWARPEAAARWGRAAVVVAVVPPVAYALTRYTWMVHPLGFDRADWEVARSSGQLLAGVWLGTFALIGAVLTLGLVQRWGEVFPRWVPRLAGRPVPVAAAVVPAGLVAAVLVPAGLSMIRQVLGEAAQIDAIADWAAFGPTFLWPLWGVALAVAALGYALRRRGEHVATSPSETLPG